MNIKNLFLVLVISALVSSCANMPQALKDNRTIIEATLAGCVVGAGLGYAVKQKSGAAAGLVIGCSIGWFAGTKVNKRKKQYATQEQFLDSEIKLARKYNVEVKKYNRNLASKVKRLRGESEYVAKQYRAGKTSYAKVQEKRNKLAKEKSTNDKYLKDVLVEYQMKKIALAEGKAANKPENKSRLKKLDGEIKKLTENIKTLQKNSLELADVSNSLEA